MNCSMSEFFLRKICAPEKPEDLPSSPLSHNNNSPTMSKQSVFDLFPSYGENCSSSTDDLTSPNRDNIQEPPDISSVIAATLNPIPFSTESSDPGDSKSISNKDGSDLDTEDDDDD